MSSSSGWIGSIIGFVSTLLLLVVLVPGPGPTTAQTTTLPACTAPAAFPPDVRITVPADGIPPELAAFSGVWEGTWESGVGLLPSRSAVEEVTASGARLIYGWGDAGSLRSGWGN